MTPEAGGGAPNPISVLEKRRKSGEDYVETEADAGEHVHLPRNSGEDHWELGERPLEGTKPAHTWISDLGLRSGRP